MSNRASLVALSLIFVSLAGCATYKKTLTDAQGKSVTCEASGKSGLITGIYLKSGFDECVKTAQANGYNDQTVAPPAPATAN